MYSVLDKLSPELAKDVALIDGVLICSDVRKGDPHLLSFISQAQRRGITNVRYEPAEEYAKKYGTAALQNRAEAKNKIQQYAMNLLKKAFEQNASDIHLADFGTYGIVKFRCLGRLKEHTKLSGGQIKSLINVIYDVFSQRGSSTSFTPGLRQDTRIVNGEYLPADVSSIRVHTEPIECLQSEPGSLMALRLLYDRTEAKGGLEERMAVLGYGESDITKLRSLTERTGLTVIAGPTGSGKSTALKHYMEARAEENPTKSYMTVEDPPEFSISNVLQVRVLANEKELNSDPEMRGRLYTNAIAGALRSDPDVIMIGEIRYPEAAMATIDAALTGHGVLATLHANNAIGIILRLASLLNAANYPDPMHYLCNHNVMAGLIYQRLLAVLCPHCKIPLTASHQTEEDKKHIDNVLPRYTRERLFKVVPELDMVHVLGRGCDHCKKSGFVSQTVAAEVVVTNEDFLRYLRRGDYEKAYNCWRKDLHGRTYVEHAIKGIGEGILDPHSAEIDLGVPLDFTHGFTPEVPTP